MTEKSVPGAAEARGAAPVGRFDAAPPIERLYVWTLRCWLDEAEGQQRVWRHYSASAGGRAGAKALSLFERQLSLAAAYARRPLIRHSRGCRCLGRDEALLAGLVSRAAEGRLEEAYPIASALFRPEGLMEIVEISAQLGAALAAVGGEPGSARDAAPRGGERRLQ